MLLVLFEFKCHISGLSYLLSFVSKFSVVPEIFDKNRQILSQKKAAVRFDLNIVECTKRSKFLPNLIKI